jgi:hypothetical protein
MLMPLAESGGGILGFYDTLEMRRPRISFLFNIPYLTCGCDINSLYLHAYCAFTCYGNNVPM